MAQQIVDVVFAFECVTAGLNLIEVSAGGDFFRKKEIFTFQARFSLIDKKGAALCGECNIT